MAHRRRVVVRITTTVVVVVVVVVVVYDLIIVYSLFVMTIISTSRSSSRFKRVLETYDFYRVCGLFNLLADVV